MHAGTGVLAARFLSRATLGSALLLCIGVVLRAPPADASASRAPTPGASASVSRADAAATRAYLEDVYGLDQALLDDAPSVRSAAVAISSRLSGECAGVLSGEPSQELSLGAPASQTPREKGERQRSQLEAQTIEEELTTTLFAATYRPDLTALNAYREQVARLSWSNPTIAQLVAFQATLAAESATSPATEACADMRMWAQSGYHVLSASSRAFQEAQMDQDEATAKEAPRSRSSVGTLLRRFENAADRRLISRTEPLRAKLVESLSSLPKVFAGLRRALGVAEGQFEKREREPVLARGKTSAGTTFLVRRDASPESFGATCAHSVTVELKEAPSNPRRPSTGGSSSGSECLTGRSPSHPSASCGGGIETLELAVPASVSEVRLKLSNGQAITTPVVRVPRRDGGPGGVYVQAVRGYTHYPVSLTELNAGGKAVRTLKVGFRCEREVPEPGPSFVNLVQGTAPGGETFYVAASIVHFGHDQTSFNLMLSSRNGRNYDEGASESSGAKPKAFQWSLGVECPPHEFAIVYGILSAPGDSVLARTPTGLVPLTKVELAPDLHSGGPLFYDAFASVPSELVVLASNGSTLYTESLVADAKEEAEYCEGYAEA